MPFSELPKDIRIKPTLCEVKVPDEDISLLKDQVKLAKRPPKTFETCQSDVSEDYGLAARWMDEAIEAWLDPSIFDWYESTYVVNGIGLE